MNKTALIRVTTSAEIEEHLRSLKESWEQKAHDAQSMVCTEDTVQTVKKLRADMRKEYEEADRQRKAAKEQYMSAWVRLEAIYKDCVKDPFTRADADYKSKIAEVEDAQKSECEKMCREYFAELCAVHHVEWLRYEQSGVRITLSESKKQTPSKLFDALSEFVARVACDVDAINGMNIVDACAVMVEYKRNGLNLAKAQKAVRDTMEAHRKERKAAEERAEKQKREAEAVAKVEAAAPVLAPPVEVKEEKLLTVKFTATATREKLIKLREWMIEEGIEYK